MNRAILASVILALLSIHAPGAEPASARPNIVVILADDLGWGSLGCYGVDSTLVETPNLDRLAREGRRFTDASTTSSVCTPTRYSLLTGRYCWRTTLQFGTLDPTSPLLIEPSRLTLASMLKSQGYRTAAIGKWHLGYGVGKADFFQTLRPGPLELGFDDHFAVPQNHGDYINAYVENDRVYGLRSSTPLPEAGTTFQGKKTLGLDAPQRIDVDVMTVLDDKVANWVDQQSAEQPFFLYYAPVAVHTPITPSARAGSPSKAGPFADFIEELDVSVGLLLDRLEKKGLAANTLVLFSSDNGGVYELTQKRVETDAINAGLKPNGSHRGGKVGIFEGGYRVPYIVRWPGHVPAGTTCNETISIVDTLATIANVTGCSLPPATEGAEDSFNVLPAWLGTKHPEPIRADLITHSGYGCFSIRKGDWKYIEGVAPKGLPPRILQIRKKDYQPQLYNLASDPAATKNVAGEHPEIVQAMQSLLDDQRKAGKTRS